MDLPHEVLVLVLQRVPQKQRLQSCALVARAWQGAAAAATPSVDMLMLDSKQSHGARAYLAQHGQHVTRLHLHMASGVIALAGPLPCPQLRSLELAGCVVELGPEGGQASGRGTHLEMSQSPSSASGSRLSALASLRHLTLSGHDTLPASLLAALANMQLTHLVLRGFTASDASLQPLSGLTSLQHFDFRMQTQQRAKWTPDVLFCGLARLPHLIALELVCDIPISPSNTPGFSQLTRLQHLDLWSRRRLQPAVLEGMTQMRHLRLCGTHLADVADVSDLLAWLAHAQHLTQLDLQDSLVAVATPAAAYSALTASSELEHLDLSYCTCTLPAGVWPHLFPEERRLPHLHTLALAEVPSRCAGRLMGTNDVECLVQCCPGLQSLTADLQAGAPMLGLQELQQLTNLSITGVTNQMAQDLAQLTGLVSLHICTPSVIDAAGCTRLTTLTKLQHFYCDGGANLHIEDEAFEGEDPDVWAQLCEQADTP